MTSGHAALISSAMIAHEGYSPLTLATYVPIGMTPLLDALGRGINDIEEGIGNLEEEENELIEAATLSR